MPKRVVNPKLSPEDEEALLKSLRSQREQKARLLLQVEAQAVARKLDGQEVAIEKVPEEAAPLVAKDKKNFGPGTEAQTAVIAITLNAVLLSASIPAKDEAANGKGGGKAKAKAGKGGGGKKSATPKIGAKVERLPPPTGDAAVEAIVKHKATLAKVTSVKDEKVGKEALLLAFESWLSNEHNEPVLPEAPKLLGALCDEGLLEKEMLVEYWSRVVSTHASDAVEFLDLQEQCKEADGEQVAASEQLKKGQKEDADAAQQAKWAAAEVQNARTGNQPTGDEVAREKAANVADTKARAHRLQKQKDIELYHKTQVSALNAQVAANNSLAEKTSQMRTCELMHQYGRPFFESIGAASEVRPVDKEAKAVDGAAASEGKAA